MELRMANALTIIAAVGAMCVADFVCASVPVVRRLNKETRATYRGIGSVHAGMSLRAAERAANDKLVSMQEETDGCTFVKPQNGPEGIVFMVIDGRIARVDIENTFTTTDEGARVGDSEARIKRLYRGRVRVTPHAYVEGHYLTVIGPDRRYGIVFETDGHKVTQYRAGRLAAVRYIEGCS
jgi:hypothetical protein